MIENLKNWWKAEKYNILLTIFAALIPLVITWCAGWAQSALKDADTHIKKQGVITKLDSTHKAIYLNKKMIMFNNILKLNYP